MPKAKRGSGRAGKAQRGQTAGRGNAEHRARAMKGWRTRRKNQQAKATPTT